MNCFRKENQQNVARLHFINSQFTKEMFDVDGKGLASMPEFDKTFQKKPNLHPHPRILFHQDMIPEILRHFDDEEFSAVKKTFLKLIETEENGILPPASEKEKGFYSFDNYKLVIIQAKALAYQLSGNREYGLEAIIAIKNYIHTMVIKWLKADICRHFGLAMYVAACVFDWCYDLLNDDDKYEIMCGVGYNLCAGETDGILKAGFTKTIEKVKMEVGFPPVRQNAVTGHGCELQLMRDFLSFAIATYEEDPTWWELVGARINNEYPPVRKIYFDAGIYPQGEGYAGFRLSSDFWTQWLWKMAMDEDLFEPEKMQQVIPSLLSFETVDTIPFHVGDRIGYRDKFDKFSNNYGFNANLAAFLFHDPCMKAWAKFFKKGYSDFEPGDAFGWQPNAIMPAEALILNSDGTKPAENRYDGMPLVRYNGGFYEMLTVRNSREPNQVNVMMKGAGRSTANHDHHDCATFQIAYKGLITGDSGRYDTYSSAQHFYYHQSTIAHNGILVFNPEMADFEKTYHPDGLQANRMRYFYSGGQRVVVESGGLQKWLTPEYDMGKTIGLSLDQNEKNPHFAYYATDYTLAYHPQTIDAIKRYMLTVYTSDTDVPMMFFVYDDIAATKDSFRKAFTFQCPTAPIIDEETRRLVLEDEGGKLVLQNLYGAEEIVAFGGEGQQYFNAKDGKPEHGINIECQVAGTTSDVWGHAELVAPFGQKETCFQNVIYVCDRGQTPIVFTEKVTGNGLDGMKVTLKNQSFVFAKKTASILLPAQDYETEYFIFEVEPGDYQVEGKKNSVSSTERMLRFCTEAGKKIEIQEN